jgi:hypothetical protein
VYVFNNAATAVAKIAFAERSAASCSYKGVSIRMFAGNLICLHNCLLKLLVKQPLRCGPAVLPLHIPARAMDVNFEAIFMAELLLEDKMQIGLFASR